MPPSAPRTGWVFVRLLLHCVICVNAGMLGGYGLRNDAHGWTALGGLVLGAYLVQIWQDLTILNDRFVHMAETIGDDDAPPGPPRGQG